MKNHRPLGINLDSLAGKMPPQLLGDLRAALELGDAAKRAGDRAGMLGAMARLGEIRVRFEASRLEDAIATILPRL
jgi:hypothetical protein